MTTRVLALCVLLTATLGAQNPPAAPAQPPAQPDFSKVEIKATKIAGNFYTLEGQGGTIGVLAGPDGVFMVDSQFAPLTDKIAIWSTRTCTAITPAATRTSRSRASRFCRAKSCERGSRRRRLLRRCR